MKRVVVDARCLGSGIGTYTVNVLSRLRALAPDFHIAAITHSEQKSVFERLCHDTITLDVPIYSAREQFKIPWVARGADLLHAMHYNAPLAHRGPMIVTIHDLTHLLDRSLARSWKSIVYARPILNCVARRADHIITDSNYSRDMIVKCLGVAADKITVIYLGAAEQFRPADDSRATLNLRQELSLARPYLLFVGNLKPHKNVVTLLEAFASLTDKFDLDLLIVGDDRYGKFTVRQKIKQYEIDERVRVLPHVSLECLVSLYSGAEMLVLPSFEEGFGLPVLEAMACGTPVVCSNAASLPEVGGDAAQYFDPHSAADLVNAIATVLESREKQAVMRDRGLIRSRGFTWDQCARQHFEIYRRYLLN